jgi:hypothetical protein
MKEELKINYIQIEGSNTLKSILDIIEDHSSAW